MFSWQGERGSDILLFSPNNRTTPLRRPSAPSWAISNCRPSPGTKGEGHIRITLFAIWQLLPLCTARWQCRTPSLHDILPLAHLYYTLRLGATKARSGPGEYGEFGASVAGPALNPCLVHQNDQPRQQTKLAGRSFSCPLHGSCPFFPPGQLMAVALILAGWCRATAL